MPPKQQKKAICRICNGQQSKYTCSRCMVPYCSVPCYKTHKESSCTTDAAKHDTTEITNIAVAEVQHAPQAEDSDLTLDSGSPSPPLRPLTSLKWPYIPEESAYHDPLKRDDPKLLHLYQYEAIATAPSIRRVLATYPRLTEILRNIDQLRGEDRQEALQRALGVSASDVRPPGMSNSNRNILGLQSPQDEEDIRVLRELAEAVEAAVRGGKEDVLGLDWGD